MSGIRWCLALLIASFLGASSFAQNQQSVRDHVHVSYVIKIGDRVIGMPKMVVREGSSATIMSDRPGGYSLRSSVKQAGQNVEMRQVESEIYLAEAGAWVKAASPKLSLTLDQASSLRLSRANGDLDISVKVSRNFDGKLATLAPTFGKNRCTAAKLANWEKMLNEPVSMVTVAQQDPNPGLSGGCCSPCSGMRCCSDGPMCCSDSHICPGGSCCN